MRVVDRHLLTRAARATLTALVVLWPFAFLAFLDRSVSRSNPLVAARPDVALLLAAVTSAPGVFALAAAGGAALFAGMLDDARESVALQLAGASPRRVVLCGLAPAAVLSIAGAALAARGLPDGMEALYESTWLRPADVPAALARLDDVPGNREVSYRGRAGAEEATLEDLRLCVRRGASGRTLALSADAARVRDGEAGAAVLVLERGTLALAGEDEPLGAVRFGRGRAELALGSLVGAGSRPWRRPSARRLETLARDAELVGGVVSDAAAATARRYRFELWFRVATALLPLLAAFPILWLSAGPRSLDRRPLDALVLFLVVVGSLGQLHATAKSLAEDSWPLALATLAACAAVPLLLAAAVVGALRRRRAG